MSLNPPKKAFVLFIKEQAVQQRAEDPERLVDWEVPMEKPRVTFES
jgi:hypothetical protein